MRQAAESPTSAARGVSATSWSRLGTLPNVSVNDLQLAGPNDSYIIAATHGRGLWKIDTP